MYSDELRGLAESSKGADKNRLARNGRLGSKAELVLSEGLGRTEYSISVNFGQELDSELLT